MSDIQGVVVTDAQGLCLKADGDLQYVAQDDSAGFFSTIAQAAAALGENEQPIVRLETTTRSLLVTRVADRTIAVSQEKHAPANEL
jgi:hypothetical protein